MTTELSLVGQLLAVGFACGLNLYATIAVVGLASRLGWIDALPPGLRGLEDFVVIASAAFLFLIEFVVDKTPHLDTLWDTIHTVIRPSAATLLTLAAVDGAPWPLRMTAAGLAGAAALSAHGAKAGFRLAINAAPGRITTRAVSLAEDAAAVALAVAALASPTAALVIASATIALVALFGPRLWRAFVLGFRALVARLRGFFAGAGWRDVEEVPRALRAQLDPPRIGSARPRATRATVSAPRPVGAFRNGWLVTTDAGPVFLYRARFRARRLTLPAAREARVHNGVWADTVEIQTDRFRCSVFVLKDGPPVELVFPEIRSTKS